jgi:hypothetical protein
MGADLDYLEAVFRRMQPTDRIARSFTVVRTRTVANANQGVSGANSKSVAVGSNSSVAEPPGT